MDKYIIYELEQLEKITGYSLQHIKNDINDVYNKLEEKDKEIERLNNNWDKLKDYIEIKRDEYSSEDNEWWFINRTLEYMEELKEGK